MALEYQRYGRNKNTLINKSYIDGGSYRKNMISSLTMQKSTKHCMTVLKLH